MERIAGGVLAVIALLAAALPAAAGPAEVESPGTASGCVTHVRWVITEARAVPFTQAAELALFDGDVRLPSMTDDPDITVTSPGGASEAPPEGPESAYDGSDGTKWIDFALVGGNESILQIAFAEPVTLDGYHWVTAGAEAERDPVSWRLEVSSDGSSWTVLDTRNDVAVTEDRVAVVGPFGVTVPDCGPTASALALAVEPSASAMSGQAFAVQPEVQVVDAVGEAFAEQGVVVTVAVESGEGTLGGTLTATTDASGRAVFTDLSISGSGEHTLGFTATDLEGIGSATVLVSTTQTGKEFGGGRSGRATSGPGENRDDVLALEPRTRGRVK